MPVYHTCTLTIEPDERQDATYAGVVPGMDHGPTCGAVATDLDQVHGDHTHTHRREVQGSPGR